MPNDAKFGLVVGVGLVITVAIVFFRKDPTPHVAAAANPAPTAPVAGVLEAAPPSVTAAAPPTVQAAPSLLAPRPEEEKYAPGTLSSNRVTPATETRHVIAEGDTLFSLARRYYGDADRFADIYQANRDVLRTPDRLPVGAVIRIP